MQPFFQDPELMPIYHKVAAQERLSSEDGVTLYRSRDLLGVGYLAHLVRERLHGRKAYYIYNQHINYSNICVNGCKFCAFGESAETPRPTHDAVRNSGQGARASGHEPIYGDPHRRRLPPGPAFFLLSGHAPGHQEPGARRCTSRPSPRWRSPTWPTWPSSERGRHPRGPEGGGPGVAARRRRRGLQRPHPHQPLPRKALPRGLARGGPDRAPPGSSTPTPPCSTATWRRVEERVDHLVRLREAQDETGGFVAFIPLAFHPQNTGLSDLPGPGVRRPQDPGGLPPDAGQLPPHQGLLDDDRPQAGPDCPCAFGVDDVDGTVIEEQITHMAGAQTPQGLTRTQLLH